MFGLLLDEQWQKACFNDWLQLLLARPLSNVNFVDPAANGAIFFKYASKLAR